ncbi:hypothetical protein J2Y45_004139 [Dyadobacter sp. BE34]|uniref:Outer membrane protein beta-barrel domain-containing protein n=1 Tax=Dyadobacter fermentans TaxID=94254 RepID=A0ABU1R0L5_9BACT|nr:MULTISPECIES: hypothetical protein [Dyadobacter]MDR6806947.1 hypothetical protein [Dyadobacter fermentans]MDR7044689.1 hypothetical protein [Dyadobacter sp. BE242]MDR7198999.1 hypothetical protein [Dyadobacter sp. BE34]MDR7216961.1 hypothetical protein [Dyadobacter sp. BE31]MDR7263513.1 hypothetical protein [Dyadobacter sp. BE32]
MSDQQPVDKRMLGRLRDHTEPYLPDAWESFELFRAAQSRKKRIALYWLGAAALLVFIAIALLITSIPDAPARLHVAEKPVRAVQQDKLRATRSEEPAASPDLPSAPSASGIQASRHTKALSRRKSLELNRVRSENTMRDPAAPLPATSNDGIRDTFAPEFLIPRAFNSPVARFVKRDIPLPQPRIHPPQYRDQAVRWGVSVLQQSNRAAHIVPESNYGVGGALLVPLSRRIALVTGISGSRQSLNIEQPARLSAAEGLPNLQRVRYHWVNLEVPVQIQYKLRTFKDISFTANAGVALQTSMGQTADYHYKTTRTIATFAETAGGPVLVSSQTVEELTSVSERDKKRIWTVGSPLYFGIGISYKWQHTVVELEPFVKYPFGASTADRLQLTTMGIQLRLTGPLKKPIPATRNSL